MNALVNIELVRTIQCEHLRAAQRARTLSAARRARAAKRRTARRDRDS